MSNKLNRLVALTMAATLGAGCADSSAELVSPVKQACDFNAKFGEAFNSGDLEKLMKLYEPGATLVGTNGQPATGTAAIREALAGFLTVKGTMTIEQKHCVPADDLAFLRVKWHLPGVGPDGNPVDLGGDTAEIVRRQKDGSWRYVVDHPFGSNDTPPRGLSGPVKDGCDLDLKFVDTFNTRNIDAILDLYEPQATLIGPTGEAATGTAAIREAMAGFMSVKGTMTTVMNHCVVADDLVLLRAKWRLPGIGPDGKAVELGGDTAEVGRRQRDGSWRFVIDHPFGAN